MTIKKIKIITLLYLAIPNFLFIVSWLNLYWSVVGSLILLASSYSYWKNTNCYDDTLLYPIIPNRVIVWICIFTLLLGYVFSMGSFGFGQSYDYYKHNAIFKDLVTLNSPIIYGIDTRNMYEGEAVLGYYFGYYIFPAFLCKLLGIQFGNILLYLWGSIGIWLSFVWFRFFTKSNINFMFILVFFLLGTTFFKPYLYVHYLFKPFIELPIIQYFIWPSGISFSLINIHFSPQHYIVATLGGAIIYYEGFVRKDLSHSVFFLSLTIFWAFLSTLGLSLFLLFFVVQQKFSKVFSLPNILGGGYLFFVMGAYMLAHYQDNNYLGWLWEFDIAGILRNKPLPSLVVLIAYACLEIGVYVWFMFKYFKGLENKTYFYLLIFCSVLYSIIPIYRLGFNNDLAMRLISIVRMFIFFLFLFYLGEAKPERKYGWVYLYMCFCIILGALSSITTLRRFDVPSISHTKGIKEAEIPDEIYLQYFAHKNSFFGKYLMKHNE